MLIDILKDTESTPDTVKSALQALDCLFYENFEGEDVSMGI